MEDSIKKYLLEEFNNEYKDDNLEQIINLFLKVLNYPINKEELNGTGNRIINALGILVTEKHDKSSLINLLPAINKIEQYSRKLLYMLDPNKYDDIINNKKGFTVVLLELNPDISKNYRNKIVNLRNDENHDCNNFNMNQLYSIINSYVDSYLKITNGVKERLNNFFLQLDEKNERDGFTDYINQVRNQFAQKINKIIQLDTKEDMNKIDFYVEEVTDRKEARSGKLKDLMKSVVEKRIILWGEAGAGKTTSLEYLAYTDAEEYLNNANSHLPVLIYLGSTTDTNLSIQDYIMKKLSINEVELIELLKKGKINLYLDGFNEIPITEQNMLKTKRKREITELLNNYSDTFIIMSNRPQDSKEFSNMPVFNLLKMNDEQIKEFLIKNSNDKDTINKINKAISEDENLKKMISRPLILRSLILITKVTGEIPKREGQIIGKFLKTLFIREKQEKFDEYIDNEKINLLLRRIGYETLENNQTNSGISKEYLLDIMNQCQKDYNFSYDNFYAIKLFLDLGIMEVRDNTYVFTHQSYQDYYHAEEMNAILGM